MARKYVGSGGYDLGNQKLTSVADGTNPSDGVNKAQLDSAIAGQSWKNAVRAASTTNGTLASAYENGDTLDGVTLATGDRILLKNQSAGAENGIYVVNVSGAPTRASDADSTAELHNATVFVREGTANADTQWTQTATVTTLGTTAQVWVQGGGGTAYSAGDGLDLSSTTFSIDIQAGGGLRIVSTELGLEPADFPTLGIVRKYAVNVPNGSTSATITHNFGTLDVTVAVYEISGGAEVECDVVLTSTNVVTLTFATAPSSGQYRCVVTG